MKKEGSKKGKLWLWLTIAVVVIAAVVAGVLLLGGNNAAAGETQTTETENTVVATTPVAPSGSGLYWNLDRSLYMEKGALSSSREPAEDGYYHIAFAYDGQEKEFLTNDKKLVNFIDTMDIMGLTFDDGGFITDAIEVKKLATEIDSAIYVQSVDGNVINVNSSITMNGMKKKYEITDDIAIYDVTRSGENRGAAITPDQMGPMDKLAVYGDMEGQIKWIYLTSHPRTSKIYWRANQFTSGGKTTRVPDENGVYTIPFYCEGELVELKCKNVTEVNYIDKQSIYSCHFGMVFDEEGFIEEAILSSEALPGIIRSERYDVTEIDGRKIVATKVIGSNVGTVDQFLIDENVKIYDASLAAKSEGRMGQEVESLSIGDRIVCFANTENEPQFIYISEHVVEEAVWCYNMERKYDSTKKETKREPDANGWYYIKVFAEGTIMTVKTQNRDRVNEMDSVGAAVFGLTLDGDVVKHVYNVRSVFGYNHFGQGRYITSAKGAVFTCFKTDDPGKSINGVMDANCKIWNLSPVGTYGAETKLQYGDYIYAYQSPELVVQQIFVMRRLVDLPIYYGLERMYDSTAKETTRKPDAEGWYYYEVCRDGKMMTVKTNSKEMANKIDAINPAVMALSVGSDGVVYEAYEARLAYGGSRRAHGYKVVSISGNVVETTYQNADGTTATRTLTLAENCKTVNITTLDFGKSTTVRVGDTITAFTDIYDETTLLVVRNRKADYLYWNQLKMYDDTNKVTMRTPDADGWYVFTLLRNDGKIVTLKTQDKAVASRVDYYGGAFTLNLKDDVITGVGSPGYAKNTNGSSLLNYDVVAVNGRTVTLSNGKETQKITLSSDCKIFEVGPDAATFGAEVKLQVGDRVRAYKSLDGTQYTYVYIRFHASRTHGLTGYCEACNKEVKWEPWVGGSFATAGGHFYLPADITTDYLPCSTGRSTFPVSNVCLDLNGHTYYRTTGRAMYVYTNGTLNIMDSVGGGTITSGGIVNGTSGGVLGVAGGTVNFYSGTLRLADEHNVQYRAGVVYVSKGSDANATPGTLNMRGGVIENGEVLSRGGNVDVNGGVFNMYDGEIRGGVVGEGYADDLTCYGGNVSIRGGATFNMYGGTISGGEAYKNGGNVYAGTGVANIYGGTITGGTTKTSGGGNIYAIGQLHIHGGTIENGLSEVKSGGNIYVYNYSEDSAFSAENCVISGGSAPQAYGGNIYCEVGGNLKNVTITGGSAKNGGNIYISGTSVMEKVVITDGVATESGGNANVVGTCDMYDVTITGGTSGARGGNIYANGVKLTVHSGEISGGTSGTGNSNGGGNIAMLGSAVVEIAGGNVIGGTSANTAGNILVGTGTLKVSGGEITGGTAPGNGADIYAYYNKSNVIITGGKIGTLTYTDAENPIEISGNPVIGLLEIAGGKLITLGEMTTGAQIAVSASGVFTTELENANAYNGVITCAVAGMQLAVDGNVLVIRGETETAFCPICNENAQWSKWDGTTLSGHVYLTENVTLDETATIPAGSELTLDLKGYKITSSARAFVIKGSMKVLDETNNGQIEGAFSSTSEHGGVLYVNGGDFQLYGGTVSYAGTGVKRGGVLYMDGASNVNLRGGIITNGITTERGGNICVGAGYLTVSGATVQNGTANSSNSNGGGNIFAMGSGTVEITGGKVIGGNTTKTGGNITVGTGSLKISGGEISGGNAAGAGNNVYLYYNLNDVEITGGTIESLYYKEAASFKLSGNPVIGILEIASGKTIELGELTDGADIKVIADGVFTTQNANAQSFVEKNLVKAYSASKVVSVEDNKLAVTDPVITPDPTPDPDPEPEPEPEPDPEPDPEPVEACVHCGQTVTWTEWNGTDTNGHFYVAADVNMTAYVEIPAGNSLVLDLRGNDVISTNRTFYVRGELILMDSVGGGEVVGAGSGSDFLGGVIRVNAGNFELYSGTLRFAGTSAKQGAVLYMQTNSTANLRGGVITDGITTERGGNICINTGSLIISGATVQNGIANSSNSNGGGNIFALGSATVEITGGKVIGGYTTKTGGNILIGTATLKVSGGEISGGSARNGANNVYLYYKDGHSEITGGTIESITYTDYNTPMELSGNPVINLLDIAAGKVINLGQLTQGAKVTVRAEGVFTAESDFAEAAITAGYISGTQNQPIELSGKTLMGAAFSNEALCQHCDKTVTWAEWDGTATNGHFYLNANVNLSAQIALAEGDTLVIDLNGYNICSEGRAFQMGANAYLGIMDTVGGGYVIAKGLDAQNGGVIHVNGAVFDLYSGTLALDKAHKNVNRGGVLNIGGDAQVTIYGGIIENGVSGERGGNIYLGGGKLTIRDGIIRGGTATTTNANGGGNIFALGSSTLEMTGGKIYGGSTNKTGGNICIGTATFKISGGEITGGKADGAGQNVYIYYKDSNAEITGGNIESVTYIDAQNPVKISGNPVIGLLEIAAGKVIELGNLTEGANITVDTEGAFTTKNTNAQDYVTAGYVKPVVGKQIAVTEGVMSMTSAAAASRMLALADLLQTAK